MKVKVLMIFILSFLKNSIEIYFNFLIEKYYNFNDNSFNPNKNNKTQQNLPEKDSSLQTENEIKKETVDLIEEKEKKDLTKELIQQENIIIQLHNENNNKSLSESKDAQNNEMCSEDINKKNEEAKEDNNHIANDQNGISNKLNFIKSFIKNFFILNIT